MKTYNGDNGNLDFSVGLDIPEWTRESAIARACGYSYWSPVGDPRHIEEILKVEPNFIPSVEDNIELDPGKLFTTK